jgi:hypothetical protein
MVTNIYIDIDGVIVANDNNAANYAAEFIEYVLTNYPDSTYWLTTHCQGDASRPIKDIGHLFDERTIEYMKMIKPTTWLSSPNKTSAIDFSKPFLWFDDDCFYGEKQELLKHGKLDNWIEVNLQKNPDHLKNFLVSFPLAV